MEAALIAFINAYLGKAGTGDTPENKGQCVGLVEAWVDVHHTPHIWGNAADLMRNADPGAYRVVQNSPTNFPPPGAIVCWNASWGAGAGHTAVVIAANTNQLVVFEQNNPEGSAPVVATHDYRGVMGWIVLR
jgi:surface antigen